MRTVGFALCLIVIGLIVAGCGKKEQPSSVSVAWKGTVAADEPQHASPEPSIPTWLRRSAIDSNGVACYWQDRNPNTSLSCVKVK